MDLTRGHIAPLFLICVLLNRPSHQIHLPGIFQTAACSNETTRPYLEPFCTCKDQLAITDVVSLCGNYVELGRCVTNTATSVGRQGSYIQHVFSPVTLNRSMGYLCKVYPDLATRLNECPVSPGSSICEDKFISAITSHYNTTIQHYCRATEDLRLCYWHTLPKDCTARVRHFYSKLSEAFVSIECTKHTDESVSDKCDKITKEFKKYDASMTCIDIAKSKTDCFSYEMTNSYHPKDRFNFFEFDIDRFYRTESWMCEIKQDINRTCYKVHKGKIDKCKGIFIEERTTLLKQGREMTVTDVCSVYSNVTSCMKEEIQPGCQTITDFLNLIFCANMPTTCHCPVEMPHDPLASRSSAATLNNGRLSPAIALFVILQCYFFNPFRYVDSF